MAGWLAKSNLVVCRRWARRHFEKANTNAGLVSSPGRDSQVVGGVSSWPNQRLIKSHWSVFPGITTPGGMGYVKGFSRRCTRFLLWHSTYTHRHTHMSGATAHPTARMASGWRLQVKYRAHEALRFFPIAALPEPEVSDRSAARARLALTSRTPWSSAATSSHPVACDHCRTRSGTRGGVRGATMGAGSSPGGCTVSSSVSARLENVVGGPVRVMNLSWRADCRRRYDPPVALAGFPSLSTEISEIRSRKFFS